MKHTTEDISIISYYYVRLPMTRSQRFTRIYKIDMIKCADECDALGNLKC